MSDTSSYTKNNQSNTSTEDFSETIFQNSNIDSHSNTQIYTQNDNLDDLSGQLNPTSPDNHVISFHDTELEKKMGDKTNGPLIINPVSSHFEMKPNESIVQDPENHKINMYVEKNEVPGDKKKQLFVKTEKKKIRLRYCSFIALNARKGEHAYYRHPKPDHPGHARTSPRCGGFLPPYEGQHPSRISEISA